MKSFAQAIITESECIGCTKCIEACPFDAIIGTHKQLHTVITTECIGCKLCLPPCPVDCIEMEAVDEQPYDPRRAKQRYKARQLRLTSSSTQHAPKDYSSDTLKSEILAAVSRNKSKKTGTPANESTKA